MATGSLPSGASDDWWVVYPATPGAKVTVTLESGGEPCAVDATGPAYDAARAAFA